MHAVVSITVFVLFTFVPMSFRRKLTLLIISCALVVAGLCTIQSVLIYNSYRLEKSAYFATIRAHLAAAQSKHIDTLNSKGMQALIALVRSQLVAGQKPLMSSIRKTMAGELSLHQQRLAELLQQDSVLNHLGYRIQYSEIILKTVDESFARHNSPADTLLARSDLPLLLIQYNTSEPHFLLGEGQQKAGFITRPNNTGGWDATLQVATTQYISVKDWQRHVIRRMTGLLVGSAVLIVLTVALFYAVFLTLLRQKKIADIRTNFANNITHELKTPLSSAVVVAKTLRMPQAVADAGFYTSLLADLDKQLEKIRWVMDSVLDSALNAPASLQWSNIPLLPLLQDIKRQAESSTHTILLKGDLEASITTEPRYLAAVLTNLADNAVKYTPAGTLIVISIVITKHHVIIEMEDDGPGIPAQYHDHLFEKLFRVPQYDIHQVRGLGLGLYLGRKYAALLGGTLIYRPRQDRGSRFILTLPTDGQD